MALKLTEVRRIAADVARHEKPPLDVVGVIAGEGDSQYAEVILTIRGCQTEPCRMMIGVRREASESECRRAVEARLREHLIEHRAHA
jgi:hypothetical protein